MPRGDLTSSLVLDPTILDEVVAEFPHLQEENGTMGVDELRKAFDITGFSLAGYEIRDLLQKEVPGQDRISVEQFAFLYTKVKENKDMGRNFRKDVVLSEKKALVVEKKEDTHTALHTVSEAEKKGYVSWINRVLGKDDDVKHHMPIAPDHHSELYDKCADGLILCKLINNSVKDTIDPRTLNRGNALKSVFKRNENLVLAVNSAEAIGCCVVNIGPQDIASGTRHLVLGLVWQVIRIGLLSEINLAHHAELVALLREGETLDDLRQLTPEELLLRWVNYHLARAGLKREINNFREDIMDSEVYANLIQQITPMDRQPELIPVNAVVASSDYLKRAGNVIGNAKVLEADLFVLPEDIAYASEKGSNREKLNLAFVANLFNNYPALEVATDPELNVEETLEEKTYRNWMNSLGVTPYVTDLNPDLRNGLVLLQLIDILHPGIVDWKKIIKKFDAKKKIFQIQDNCSYVVDYAKKVNLKVINLSGENIRCGDPHNVILGLCFQLMRAYTLKILNRITGQENKRFDDSEILAWANQRLKDADKSMTISSFKDAQLATGLPLLELVDAIVPGTVNRDLISDDSMANCKLAISLARRIGARVYALPDHLVELNKNMIMTIFACLMILDVQVKAAAAQ